MALNTKLIQEIFPKVQFAFYGNHINRYKQKFIKKSTPKIDLILAVDDIVGFHKENTIMNKNHYTVMNRATRNRVLNYFQNRGAKVHFNYMKMEDPELSQHSGEKELIDVRYGVIQTEDLVRDLNYWETMLVSTMMTRPIKTIIKNDEIWEHQNKNLKSAMAMGALMTKNGDSESSLYENIVSIPHYHTKWLQLLDKEDEQEVVKENIEKFQEFYMPIWNSTFKNCFAIENGKIEIDHSPATRKFLMSQINDNVFQNINSKISVRQYDQEQKFHKIVLDETKKKEIIDEVIEEHKDNDKAQNQEFTRSIDKILIAHRNTKFFLFCMSWQFFLVYFLVKKSMQGIFLYYMYKKAQNLKKAEESQLLTNSVPQ